MSIQYIPQIWAGTILKSLQSSLLPNPFQEYLEQARQEQERRMMEDPDYARAYELRKAEDAAEDYWTALYENWFPPDDYDEDDNW